MKSLLLICLFSFISLTMAAPTLNFSMPKSSIKLAIMQSEIDNTTTPKTDDGGLKVWEIIAIVAACLGGLGLICGALYGYCKKTKVVTHTEKVKEKNAKGKTVTTSKPVAETVELSHSTRQCNALKYSIVGFFCGLFLPVTIIVAICWQCCCKRHE